MSTRKDKFSKKDKKYMSLALTLASARHGLTGKNPSVGCVIVKNDEITLQGQHTARLFQQNQKPIELESEAAIII